MPWIARVSEIEPIDGEDHENGKWECVAKYKFADRSDGHSDTTIKVPRAADGDEGGRVRALKFKETENRDGVGDEEA